MKKQLLLVLSFLGSLLVTHGQASSPNRSPGLPNYCIEVWDAERGLPQNVVTAVLQTRDGYLWAGTYTGLARFDGVRFTTFDSGHTPGLNNSRVTSLFEDSNGILWIGHETGDLSRCIQGRFEPVITASEWSGGSILAIGEDRHGEVWVADVLGRLLRVSDGLTIGSGRSAGAAWGLTFLSNDGAGRLCLTYGEDLTAVADGTLEPVTVGGRPALDHCQIIASSRDGGLWVVGDGLIRKWKNESWVANLGTTPWDDDPPNAMLETKNGILLVGTVNDGLYAFAPGSPPVHWTRSDGLPHDWVRNLCEDREGNIWAATSGGLVALRPRKVSMYGPADAWDGRAVLGITASRDGAIWAGTEGAGLYRFFDGEWSRFGAENGLTNLFIWSVLQDREDRIWAGSWGGGLRVLRDEDFVRPNSLADVPAVVAALAEARDGSLLVGTSAGLMRLSDDGAEWLTPTNEPSAPDVRAIAETPDGSIWFGTSGGGLGRYYQGEVTRFHPSDGLPSNFIMSLLADTEGTLWIGTLDSGMSVRHAGKFGTIGVEAGLPSSLICSLQDDGQGHLWISSQNGLFRAAKSDLIDYAEGRSASVFCLSYGKAEGMATVVCAAGFQPSGCRTPDGRLWFPTPKGLAALDPNEVSRNPVPPPVIVEEVLVDDRVAPLDAAQTPTEDGRTVPLVTVPPGRQRFEFHYTGLSFSAPDRVRFRTILAGIEDDWSDSGTRRSVNYSYLPHGRYTFRVIACNNDGVWNETGAAVVLRLLPHFWQTLWFQGGMLLAGAVAVGLGVRYQTRRRMRRKLEQVERQQALERERSRIAQDIHDDLGASLTRITMLSHTAHEEMDSSVEGAGYLHQIYNTARELTRAMDEIVWAVNPRHDTLDSLVNYLGRFAQQFLSAAEIRCRLDVPVQLPTWPLSSETRHNLFLAFKEALNNTVKHAAAHEVQVSLTLTQSGFTLSVMDDGRGFNPSREADKLRPGGGNGLRNMRQRLAQIRGTCEIQSKPGCGTTVQFTVHAGGHSMASMR